MASFRELGDAEHAKSELNRNRHSIEVVIAVSGIDVIRFAESRLRNRGLIGTLFPDGSELRHPLAAHYYSLGGVEHLAG